MTGSKRFLPSMRPFSAKRRWASSMPSSVSATLWFFSSIRFVRLGLGRHRREQRRHLVHPHVQFGVILGLPRDDQRGARLVDEDGVHLVHDRELQLALRVVVDGELHVVAEVIEAELVVLAVGDVRAVRRLLLHVALLRDDHAHAEAEEVVEAPHPLGVAAREVVVHRDDVHALALERVEVAGEGRDQRLALAGLHLGDLPLVQHDAADELHVVVPHPERPPAAFAADREGLDEQRVERGAVVELLAELGGLGLELLVGEPLDLALELVDGGDARLDLADLPLVAGLEEEAEDLLEHRGLFRRAGSLGHIGVAVHARRGRQPRRRAASSRMQRPRSAHSRKLRTVRSATPARSAKARAAIVSASVRRWRRAP